MKTDLGLYLHVPFCGEKCYYCDFLTYARQEKRMDSYVHALKAEIRHYGTGEKSPVDSIYDLILATRDWHEPDHDNGGHISKAPDYADTWPAHCVQGTSGADYHANLDIDYIQVHIIKGMKRPDYSGFQGEDMEIVKSLDEVLKDKGISQVDIVGLAEDHCVKATALDALDLGYKVRVIKDLTAPVTLGSDALEEVVNKGGVVI